MAEAPDVDPSGPRNTEGPTATADVPSSAPAGRGPRGRRILVAVLVVLGCVLAPLSVLSVWLKTTLLDTDNYVSTVAPLVHDTDIQSAVADRVTNRLVVDSPVVQEVVARLPERAEFLGPKITDALSSVVHDAALSLVQSDGFATLWEEANRRAHTRIVALLEGKGTDSVQTEGGEIVLEIGEIAGKVNSALEERGIDAFSSAASSAADEEIVLVKSVWLERGQNVTNLLQSLAVVLPILTLLCFAFAIWLSRNRRRTILRSALGLALGMAFLLVVFNVGRHFYLDVLPASVNEGAAGAVYDQLLSALRLALRTGFVFALVVALAAWLAGPAKPATRMRESILRAARGTGTAGGEPSALGTYVARRKSGLRILVVGIGVVVLVALSAPTPAAVIAIAVLVLLGILLIEFLGRRAAPLPEATT